MKQPTLIQFATTSALLAAAIYASAWLITWATLELHRLHP